MTETLTGKQVLALLAQDDVPEIEYQPRDGQWIATDVKSWCIITLIEAECPFRIKPTPQRRLSVTLANGEVVSWPEPVREALSVGKGYWAVFADGTVDNPVWVGSSACIDLLEFGNVHLTREAAQEHADALRLINNQTGR